MSTFWGGWQPPAYSDSPVGTLQSSPAYGAYPRSLGNFYVSRPQLPDDESRFTTSSTHAKPPDFSSALNSYEYSESSDLKIVCGTKSFAVHKVIICPQSRYFRAACSKNFMEGQTGIITLPENESPLLDPLLEFLYTSTYTAPATPETSLHLHLNMFIMGDKYDIPRLSDLSTQRFRRALQACGRMDVFFEIIPPVYETVAAAEMRDAVVQHAVTWRECLATVREGYQLAEAFRQVLRDVPDFAVEFVQSLVHRV